MQKTIFLVSSALLLAACTSQQSPQSVASQTEQQTMNEFEKISRAIQDGKSVRCQLTKTSTNQQMTYSLKGNKMRMNGIIDQESDQEANMMSDGSYIYTWSNQTQQGVKMPISDDTVQEQAADQLPDLSKQDEWQTYEDQGFQVSCSPAEIADSEFIPPSTVQFMDMSQLMQNLEDMQNKADDQQLQMDELIQRTEQGL